MRSARSRTSLANGLEAQRVVRKITIDLCVRARGLHREIRGPCPKHLKQCIFVGGEAVPIQRRRQSRFDDWLAPKPSWLLRVPKTQVLANGLKKVLNALYRADTSTGHPQAIPLRAARIRIIGQVQAVHDYDLPERVTFMLDILRLPMTKETLSRMTPEERSLFLFARLLLKSSQCPVEAGYHCDKSHAQ